LFSSFRFRIVIFIEKGYINILKYLMMFTNKHNVIVEISIFGFIPI